ncbi:MAG: response regulator transcription factor [Mangrovibacterium sp.]
MVMIDSKDFFICANTIDYVPEKEYMQLQSCLDFLEAVARVTYKSIYVIDYYRKNFLYVSDNPFFLCGLHADTVKELGYEFYVCHVPEEDMPLLLEINRAGFAFWENIPLKDRSEYAISYNFHIQHASGKTDLINHQLTPLRLTPDGKMWLALCIASIPAKKHSGYIEVHRKGLNNYWSYRLEDKRWKECNGIELKDAEKKVLKLSAQGYTMAEIASMLFKSIDTVKSYKRSLFEKLGVDNIAEAISFATSKKII